MPTLVPPTVPVGFLAAQPHPTVEAEGGVLLRPWVPGDAPAVMAAYQDAEIERWHVRRADSVAEAEEWIAGWRDGWAAEAEVSWAVVDPAHDVLLGRAALKALNLADGTAQVAYWTVPAARGHGVAPRAVEAMASWAFDAVGFQRLDLEHAVGNAASCRVADKSGFPLEGVRRSAWLQADGRHDAHVHARLRSN
ncbi:GNAT family N-acetyltransferase [Streptomyces sp. NRRL B-24484]|uniref:GNAT family N-acetyltransferase n=1 Tax=Streptomyces sp. NRRL B-24484 TaxID=1463833 RepID=UPI0004BEE7B9|nr:GNAT family N-acetyltransferase [Streptomyces sp. NRRL B-24484]